MNKIKMFAVIRAMATIRATTIGLVTMALFSCSGGQNFSEFPGFVEHFKQYPPKNTAPTEAEVTLLEQFKPTIFLAKDQRLPVNFYSDYISHGKLLIDGKVVSGQVTPELLNQHRDNPKALFKYTGDYRKAGTPTVFGRIDNEKTKFEDNEYQFTFLSYNLVFPVSGILKGLGALQSFALAVGGNLDDWHQLDHYVAVTVALLDGKAVAATLQQHNYHTTYLLNASDSGFAVDVAMRSNEIYPHSPDLSNHPAVSFLTDKNLEFVLTGNNKSAMAGFDVTHGQQAISYELAFLPQTDAFYQFKGSLGKGRLLPGRSGPPGADYATLPGLMPRLARMVTGYRAGITDEEIALYAQLFDRENFAIRPQAIKAYKDRFFKALLL